MDGRTYGLTDIEMSCIRSTQ